MQCSECGKMVRGRAHPTGKCKGCRDGKKPGKATKVTKGKKK